MSDQPVRIVLELPADQAWAIAQFVKRAGLSDYRVLAQSEREAYAMREAGDAIGEAFAAAGCAPR